MVQLPFTASRYHPFPPQLGCEKITETKRFVPNYNSIKATARKHRTSIRNLIALAPQNDPYYVGSPTEIRSATWMANIVRHYLTSRNRTKVHDRAIHYYILSQGIQRPIEKEEWKTYTGDSNDFAFTMKAIQNGRQLGLIPWESIEDKKNPEPLIRAYYWSHEDLNTFRATPEEITNKYLKDFMPLNPQLQQAYHLEIWTEKTTINDILVPIAERYGINLQTFSGQATLTKVYELIERIVRISKPVRILYVSDYDKYGHNMPVATARKIQWFVDNLHNSGTRLDVKLDKILLTEEQIDRYHLPSAPDEPNKVELDALEVFHPGETANILEEAVTKYIDLEVYEQVEQLNHELRDEAYQKVLEKLDPIRNQLESIRLDTELQGQLSSAAIVEEGDNWLYASTRSYINQTFNFRTFLDSRDESEPSPRSVE